MKKQQPKADKKIVAKLAAGLKSREAHEAEVIERMNKRLPGASWYFVSRLDAFSRCERVLVSVPND